MPPAEARHHANLAPRRLDDHGLMEAFDQETEQPYYYHIDDGQRILAHKYGVLDTSVSTLDWGFDAVNYQTDLTSHRLSKPRRSQYPRGAGGQRAFREAREEWFDRKKGVSLRGSVAEQVRMADNASRNERVRS